MCCCRFSLTDCNCWLITQGRHKKWTVWFSIYFQNLPGTTFSPALCAAGLCWHLARLTACAEAAPSGLSSLRLRLRGRHVPNTAIPSGCAWCSAAVGKRSRPPQAERVTATKSRLQPPCCHPGSHKRRDRGLPHDPGLPPSSVALLFPIWSGDVAHINSHYVQQKSNLQLKIFHHYK